MSLSAVFKYMAKQAVDWRNMVRVKVWHTHTTVWLLKNYSQRILTYFTRILLLDLMHYGVHKLKYSKVWRVNKNHQTFSHPLLPPPWGVTPEIHHTRHAAMHLPRIYIPKFHKIHIFWHPTPVRASKWMNLAWGSIPHQINPNWYSKLLLWCKKLSIDPK